MGNYVALHYNAMQMSFLHCFYGIGVTVSPYLMSIALSDSMDWRGGYRTVFFIQLVIAILSILSLPLWKKIKEGRQEEETVQALSLLQMIRRKKIWASCGVFACISALESTCLIWGSTYLSESIGLSADMAAALITFYFVGITLGLFLIGLGNGPVFPNMTHLTPILYKKETSQSIIGIEMAFSNLSILLTPVLFGFISSVISVDFFPIFLTIMFVLMAGCTIVLKIADFRSQNAFHVYSDPNVPSAR